MQEADRLKRLPLYLFTVIDELKEKAIAAGKDVIDLGMGNPDFPSPQHIVDALCESMKMPAVQRYSKRTGPIEKRLRQAISDWYMARFNVSLDPETEILPLIGSKEGIAHLSLAFLNHDDIGLVPSPAYPVHFNGVIMAGGILYNLPTSEETGFLPELSKIQPQIFRMAKLMFLSYPNNPTTTVVDKKFFQEVVDWGKGKDIIIGHDLAYSDIVYGDYKAPSILQIKGAKNFCIEFHTLSKSYNMAGWRIGFCVGSKKILATLEKTKSYVDFGIFRAVQIAAIAALTGPQDCVKETVKCYEKRLKLFVKGLNEMAWEVQMPKATFYIWARIPLKYSALSSMEFATLLIKEVGVAVAPGTGFGEYGERYVRFAMVESENRLKEALRRLKRLMEI